MRLKRAKTASKPTLSKKVFNSPQTDIQKRKNAKSASGLTPLERRMSHSSKHEDVPLRNQMPDTIVNYKVNASDAEYNEVVARYTNADGTKKPGWLKAPNGKKSNLTERQWVQVRTPAFKQWFGDWEKGVSTTTEAEAKERIRAWRDSRREFLNIDSGRIAELKSDWGKIFSSKAKGQSASYESHYVAAAHLDVLFESGIKYAEENPRNGSPDVKGYAKYLSAFSFNGETYVAKITVKEYPDATKLKDGIYSVEAIVVEKIDIGGNNAATAYLNGQPLDPDVKGKIANLIDSVNSISKVVDENGEPMVMYHGTDGTFTSFSKERVKPGAYGDGFYFAKTKERAKLYGDNIFPVFLNARASNRDAKRLRIEKDYIHTSTDDFIVLSPTQIKSATDNVGTFDEKNPDIRYRMAEVANDAPYGVRVATLGNAIRNGAYDMFVNYQGPLFRAYRAITKGKQVDDAYNVEAASKNVHGKIRAKIESVEHRYLEPLMDIIKQNNLDADRLDDYLYAKFAPERNAMIAARTAVVDPETGELVAMEEDGSGMSNERARVLMARLASDPILIASILSTLPNAPLLR